MEKNRMDKRIKEIFEGRRIDPSEGSWNRIEQGLEGTVYYSNKRSWRWGIAAGFTGILMISLFWVNRNTDNPIVDKESVVTKVQAEAGIQEEEQDPTIGQPQNIAVFKESESGEVGDQSLVKTEDMIALEKEDQNPEVFLVEMDVDFVPLEKVDLKVAQVVSQVTSLENSGNQVEDEVIDSLLREAQEQLLKERVLTSSDKVDAMALLSEVEDDLNKSFRDQLFEKLKEGYLKVRTAVAYRND